LMKSLSNPHLPYPEKKKNSQKLIEIYHNKTNQILGT